MLGRSEPLTYFIMGPLYRETTPKLTEMNGFSKISLPPNCRKDLLGLFSYVLCSWPHSNPRWAFSNVVLSNHISIWLGYLQNVQRILISFKRPPTNSTWSLYSQLIIVNHFFLGACRCRFAAGTHTNQTLIKWGLFYPFPSRRNAWGLEKKKKGIPRPAKRSLHPEPSCQSTFSRGHSPGRSRLGMRTPEQANALTACFLPLTMRHWPEYSVYEIERLPLGDEG